MMSQGSPEKMKALKAEHEKTMPSPGANPNQPVTYGTTPAQDKMQAALKLLGAGQSFPNSPQTGE